MLNKILFSRNKKAFSLLEMLAAVAIFSVIVGSLYGALAIARISWTSSSINIMLQQEARKALDTMSRNLRGASSITDPHGGNSITYNGSQRFSFVNDPDVGGVIEDENGEKIALYVQSLGFTYDAGVSRVNIYITFSKNTYMNQPVTYTVSAQVNVR